MKENNYDNIFFYYAKNENKLYVEARGIVLESAKVSIFNKNIEFYNIVNIDNNFWWYSPHEPYSENDEIRIEIKDKDNNIVKKENLQLNAGIIPNNENIKYVSGALLGDFIYQLSIIKEMYLKTGKKGDLYILFKTNDLNGGNVFEFWRLGVIEAYNNLKEIILSQDYISSFQIYQGEKFDSNFIHLSSWRDSNLLGKTSIYEIFKSEYGVEWGSHKWLELPKLNFYDDCILISNTMRKKNKFFDYSILDKYDKKIFFATTDIEEYNFFQKETKNKYDLIFFNNLLDYWIAINSCYLFVCCFGSFLAVANALHKNTIALLPDYNEFQDDVIHFSKNISNLKWYENEESNNIKNNN